MHFMYQRHGSGAKQRIWGADMSDSRDFKIESAMSRIMGDFPLDMKEEES